MKKTVSLLLVVSIITTHGTGIAGSIPGSGRALSAQSLPAPAATALPEIRSIIQGIEKTDNSDPSVLNIIQNSSKAVIEWNSFNIGSVSTVNFVQRENGAAKTDWAALNRIYQQSPSLIYGRLNADGKVYLINQNGILFGPGSQVNVSGLIAASLNISNSDFLAGTLHFLNSGNYNPDQGGFTQPGTIANYGAISTGALGSVFLMGPVVENHGSIDSPSGQIGLAAGTDITVKSPDSDTDTRGALYVNINAGAGSAVNHLGAQVLSDNGFAGMYGNIVQQDGLIRAVSSIKKNGRIELLASEKVATGGYSETLAPITDSRETAHESFEFNGGEIWIGGLDVGGKAATGVVEHLGRIYAPSGTVSIYANDRVYLENGSSINVSGSVATLAASANQIEVKLNSVNLSDDFGQKNGILKGETIKFDALTGSAIGNVSDAINAREKTAAERSVTGGDIIINVAKGDVIMKENASISFAGGYISHEAGSYTVTQLVAGNNIYDIIEAPQWLTYDRITERTVTRSAYVEGADAGSLTIQSGRVVLDGKLDGSVIRGRYQNLNSEIADIRGNSMTSGRREALAGVLTIGNGVGDVNTLDPVLFDVTLKANVTPWSYGVDYDPFTAEGPQASALDAAKLNAAGLREIDIYAVKGVTIDKGAAIALQHGGAFTTSARRIVNMGSISVPSGSVKLIASDNRTSFAENDSYLRMVEEGILLASGSSISTRGERMDVLFPNGVADVDLTENHLDGGTIEVRDSISARGYGGGLDFRQGAVLDVSGGYLVGLSGGVTGGDAGTLSLQGTTIALNGTMLGLSLTGYKGGSVSLHTADDLLITSGGGLSAQGVMNLAGGVFDESGFAGISISSAGNVTVGNGAVLAPSHVKLSSPRRGRKSAGPTVRVADDLVGDSSISLESGKVLDGVYTGDGGVKKKEQTSITLQARSRIYVAPGGNIELAVSADDQKGAIAVSGELSAPGGDVSVSSTQGLSLVGAKIYAGGYAVSGQPAAAAGLPANSAPLDGGNVTLSAGNGDLLLDGGSVVDVSGSAPFTNSIKSSGRKISYYTTAAAPGSVTLSSEREITVLGSLRGASRLNGMPGGRLSIVSKNTGSGFALNNELLRRLSGFADMTFKSNNSIVFTDDLTIAADSSLTIDAPVITGKGNADVCLTAPWVTLENTYLPSGGSVVAGDAGLTVDGKWIDITGDLVVSGFANVTLRSGSDLRLTDQIYKMTSGEYLARGALSLSGNLAITADRIYPANHQVVIDGNDYGYVPSDYSIKAGNGRITIDPAGGQRSGYMFSGGGSLNITAGKGIDMKGGTLAAPQGSITLTVTGESVDGRIHMADGSVVTTAGDGAVAYGYLDTDLNMWLRDRSDLSNQNGNLRGTPVDSAPAKSVKCNADQVVVEKGALINVSGGGSVFAYSFLPGISGTYNPLTKSARYVIIPGNMVNLPGKAVYLAGSDQIAAGVYTLLPEQYAFLPGAMILTDLGGTGVPGGLALSKEGYATVAGYFTVAGTNSTSGVFRAFSIRSASDVLKEGEFSVAGFVSGDAGAVSIVGNTTVLQGNLYAARLAESYSGGKVTLAGKDIYVTDETVNLVYDPSKELSDELLNKLTVSDRFFNGMGLEEINLGVSGTTDMIAFAAGSRIESPRINLRANRSINIGEYATLIGVDGNGSGEVSLNAALGTITIGAGTLVQADGKLSIDTADLELSGDLRVDRGMLSLTGAEVILASDGAERSAGIFLTQSQWNRITGVKTDENGNVLSRGPAEVVLRSRGSLTFQGDFSMVISADPETGVRGDLVLDSGRIAAGSGTRDVTVAAGNITLKNSGDAVSGTTAAENAAITFSADNKLTVAGGSVNSDATGAISVTSGDVRLDGFRTASLSASGDLTFSGKGRLQTEGTLELKGARITTSYLRDAASDYYIVANYQVSSGGAVTIGSSGGTAGGSAAVGGTLAISGKSIDQTGIIDTVAGRVTLTATGTDSTDGIMLHDGAVIRTSGSEDAAGGWVTLKAASGAVTVAENTLIDVSAGGQGDAGVVSLGAAAGGVSIAGVLSGRAGENGNGGNFVMDTSAVENFGEIISLLDSGGFTGGVDVRTRTGDLEVIAGQTLTAKTVALTTDSGSIGTSGTIDASTAGGGGSVELHAEGDVAIRVGGEITAASRNPGAEGGSVTFSSSGGYVRLERDGIIDVSAGSGGAKGTVAVEAPRNASNNDVLASLDGTINGAGMVDVVGYRTERYTGSRTITSTDATGWLNTAAAFMAPANVSAIRSRLLAGLGNSVAADSLKVRPGIDVQATGNLTLGSAVDLTSTRFGGESGVLLLRAGGDLAINNNLVDHPTALSSLTGATAASSWNLGLVAGADFTSASPYTVRSGPAAATVDLAVASGRTVYTETGDIRFASAGSTTVGTGGTAYMINPGMYFNIGTFSGAIRGVTGGSLNLLSGGKIQSALGDIDIRVGGDLLLGYGAIRTTGQKDPADANKYAYMDGGDIILDVNGSVTGYYTSDMGWEKAYSTGRGATLKYYWGASYDGTNTVQGLATMGDGNLLVRTGGSFAGQAGAFGEGNLLVNAGGDILGRYVISEGDATLSAFGNIGAHDIESTTDVNELNAPVITAYAARSDGTSGTGGTISLTAQGDITLGTIVNPTIAAQGFAPTSLGSYWVLGYSQDSSVDMVSHRGNVTLTGDSYYSHLAESNKWVSNILPSTLSIKAAEGIYLNSDFALAPSATGSLVLEAGTDISGANGAIDDAHVGARVVMSDMDPDDVYGRQASPANLIESTYEHSSELSAEPASAAVKVTAGRDIGNLHLELTRSAEISAGRDIRDLHLVGQNLNAGDVTTITAQRDIVFTTSSGVSNDYTGIKLGGPGYLLVQAGRNVDLGASEGIQTLGGYNNYNLGSKGSTLILLAGIREAITAETVEIFFNGKRDGSTVIAKGLRDYGDEYARLKAEGAAEEAENVLREARTVLIGPLISGESGTGEINMVNSQISTLSGADNVYILSAGSLNVGKTSFTQDTANTGIYTAAGGSINIFTIGDVNVNESRVMTFRGGDITVWSDQGSINAGRGSTTAINVQEPKLIYQGEEKIPTIVFTPPAVGSGLRTLTYDPDGYEGPEQALLAGNIYLFAPSGVIDAGEAGISGNRVVLGANAVLNAKNISFSSESVGFSSGESTVNLSAVSGVSELSDSNRMIEQSALGSARNLAESAADKVGNLISGWLDVKVISFDTDDKEDEKDDKKEEKS